MNNDDTLSVRLPNDPEVLRTLKILGKQGHKKGHYILRAVRERMEREGLLSAKKGAQ